MGTYDMTAYLWRKDEVPMIYSSASVGTRKNGENLGWPTKKTNIEASKALVKLFIKFLITTL